MASDAGDDTGRSFERALERVAASLALHQVREAARSRSAQPEGADERPDSRRAGSPDTTTFVTVPMDDERQRDQVVDALRARSVECEAVDGATGGPSVVIAERDRGQAVDAARELALEARRGREAPTEERRVVAVHGAGVVHLPPHGAAQLVGPRAVDVVLGERPPAAREVALVRGPGDVLMALVPGLSTARRG